MRQGGCVIEGWPELMTTEMATRYLSIDEDSLFRLAARHQIPAVEVDAASIRWRKQDLDRIIKKLPSASDLPTSDKPMHMIRLESVHIEAIATAVAQRLEREPSVSGRKLISIKEAGTIL